MSRKFLTEIYVGLNKVLHAGDGAVDAPMMSIDGNAMVQTGTHRWYNDTGRTLTVVSARGSAGTAPTGADLIIDINKNGTTLMTGTKVVIAAGTNTIKQTTFSTTTIADGDYITFDVDQIGSTVAGGNVVCQLQLAG